jgi:hypothetical protein
MTFTVTGDFPRSPMTSTVSGDFLGSRDVDYCLVPATPVSGRLLRSRPLEYGLKFKMTIVRSHDGFVIRKWSTGA